MTGTIEQLKSQASILSAPDRAELAYFLLSSLEPEEEGVQEAWRTEIAHRAAEIRSGAAVGRTADEVLAELKEEFRQRESIKKEQTNGVKTSTPAVLDPATASPT